MKTTKHNAFWDNLMSEMDEKEYKRTERRMELAAFIYSTIRAKGMSQKDFAKLMGKKPSEISKWLSGTHNLTLDTISDIEDALKIKIIQTEQNSLVSKSYNSKITVVLDTQEASSFSNKCYETNLSIGTMELSLSTPLSIN
ncbi:MAG: helix-turn-helix domain-containing protein [Phocaeicola sp.]